MKNLLKKSAVATAVAGSLMLSGVASADSLLAPLVIGIADGAQTYFSIKVRGKGIADSQMANTSKLHYVWFKKGTVIDDLRDLSKPCSVSNNNGTVSPWDMVNQHAVTTSTSSIKLGSDFSTPNAYTAGNFVGFATITDSANVNANPAVKDLANEGDMSGFGYVVDGLNSFVLDYKLLNNHRSKVEGDFSAGFISKKSIDYSWMPTSIAATEWLTVVTGDDMLKAESAGGKYDATVLISQKTLAGSASPLLPMGNVSGAYNNDETVISGTNDLKVTCIGKYNRSAFLGDLAVSSTNSGGWSRFTIQNSTTTGAAVATSMVASGAITYKSELINFSGSGIALEALEAEKAAVFGINDPDGAGSLTGNGLLERNISDNAGFTTRAPSAVYNGGVVSFQIETSGHLSSTPESHPNRPY